jgi:hypothetical protein
VRKKCAALFSHPIDIEKHPLQDLIQALPDLIEQRGRIRIMKNRLGYCLVGAAGQAVALS